VASGNDWKNIFAIYPGDYNGDGITDLYLVGSAAYGGYFCAGGPGLTVTASCVQTFTNSDWKGAFAIYPGDYNGDGLTDLYLVGTTAGYFCAGGPNLTVTASCVQTFTDSDWKDAFAIYPGDYNGDGLTDLYLVGTTAGYFCAGGPNLTVTASCVQTFTDSDWEGRFCNLSWRL